MTTKSGKGNEITFGPFRLDVERSVCSFAMVHRCRYEAGARIFFASSRLPLESWSPKKT